MKRYVADANALLRYWLNSPELGPAARQVFQDAEAGLASIVVPAIALAEVFYANQKSMSPFNFQEKFQELRSHSAFELIPFQAEDVCEFDIDAAIPEMHDRIIVGVARRLQATCLTRDSLIRRSGVVPTLW